MQFQRQFLSGNPGGSKVKKKRIWQWMAAMGTFTLLASCQAVMRPYANVNLVDGAEYEVSGAGECRRLLTEVVSSIRGQGRHEFYVIGKDYEPETLVIAQMFPEVINISNTKLRAYEEDGHTFTVCRIGFERQGDFETCAHVWEKEILEESGCLQDGVERLFCRLCGWEEQAATAALGHLDQDGDSLCDRCGQRFLAQNTGDRILISYDSGAECQSMEFLCVEENYGGGMLYESVETIPVAIILERAQEIEGSEEEKVRWWLKTDFYNGISVKGACLDVVLLDTGGNPVAEGEWTGEKGIRPGLVLSTPVTEEKAEKSFWSLGDIQTRRLGKNTYRFRCIDDDYRDSNSNYQRSALFLCETVIRSDIDSTDSQREILPFGETNQYKKSTVRAWLQENSAENSESVMTVYTGVNSAFEGKTPDGMYSQMTEKGLTRRELPFQLVVDRMFLLSVEEALEYREELWDPEGAGSPYSRGYWLRTPAFLEDESGNYLNGTLEYVVDLERGCLHPAEVTDTTFGIRPAFCLPQA